MLHLIFPEIESPLKEKEVTLSMEKNIAKTMLEKSEVDENLMI